MAGDGKGEGRLLLESVKMNENLAEGSVPHTYLHTY